MEKNPYLSEPVPIFGSTPTSPIVDRKQRESTIEFYEQVRKEYMKLVKKEYKGDVSIQIATSFQRSVSVISEALKQSKI